ncbi:MAG: hypothetical protein EBR51_12630 [Gammaproteobacteria bacterium]|nr:hypothetical protein [Gammaproteobacteria bacterium]
MFREATNIELINVPYGGGGPATIALLGGHTSMMVGNVLECSPYIGSGRMRAIAVTSIARSSAVPQVPTVAESGYPGFDATNWFGAMVRAGTPRAYVDRLSLEIGRALQLPEVNDALARVGLTAGAMTPAEFGESQTSSLYSRFSGTSPKAFPSKRTYAHLRSSSQAT